MAFCVVLITAPAGEKAAALARLLVEQKLAACVNRVPGVESVYWWKGKVESGAEELLIAKTDKLKVKALVKAVKAAHPYETPEVIALRIKEGNRDYLRWIADSLGTPRKKQRVPTGLPKKPREPKKTALPQP
ncbi:MAG TPA: divalent-cation tolerance protein CutA [bacterium]|jgi:periplasmic divalent cation tolerance protein|nr:divalent-cation tolerance protein CutA [bacterium]